MRPRPITDRPARAWLGGALAIATALVSPSPRAKPAKPDPAEACAEASEKAQLLKIQGKLRAARAAFLECIADACPTVIKKDCAQFLVDVEAATPTVVVGARDTQGNDLTDVRVLVDGAPFLARLDPKAIPMDPGVYKFRFEAEGKVPVERTVVVREGERNRAVEVTLEPIAKASAPLRADSGPPTLAWVTAGLGLVALGTFTVVGLSARSDFGDLRDTCGSRCAPDDVDRVRRKALVADVSLAVAVVSIGLSTWLFVDHARRGPKLDLRAGARPEGGAFLGLSGTF